jgi:ABC-type transporter Mla subunit MlaD
MEPLNQAANSANRSVEQIAIVAQRFDGAQATTGQLVESLNAAAQRFEGVDKELASTLNELQLGLQGFTKQVSTFVGQTDQNLAKAATHLGSLVKGLQDTLDDFAPAERS